MAAAIAIVIVSPAVTVEAMLLAAIAMVLALALMIRLFQNRLDLFEPLTVFVLVWTVLFFARPIAMFITGSFDTSGYQVRDGMAGMLFMALTGCVGFLGAYALPVGRSLGRKLDPLPEIRHLARAAAYAIAIAMIGVLMFAAFIAISGGFSTLLALMSGRQENAIVLSGVSTTAYLQGGLALTLPASLILFYVASKRRSLVLGGLGLGCVLVGLVVSGPSGIRGWILPYVGAPFILLYLSRNRRPGVVLVLLLLFVGFGLNGFIADARDSATRQTTGISQLLSQNFTRLGDGWTRFVLGGDTEMPNLLALEVMKVPSIIPFMDGAATGQVLVQPIPRQFWPSKPRSGDEVLTRTLFVETNLNAASRQYTPMANFYLDFGYIGVLFGMAFLGILMRVFYEYFRINSASGSVQLIYAAALPFLFALLRGSIADVSGRLVFILPPLVLGVYLARQQRSSHTDAHVTWVSMPAAEGQALT